MMIIMEPKSKVYYTLPKRLLLKWIRDVCDKEGRPRNKPWEYARVKRTIWAKACTWAAHQFAKQYPQELGVDERWDEYRKFHIVNKGNVELIKVEVEPVYNLHEITYRGNYAFYRLMHLIEDNRGFIEFAVEYPEVSQQELDVLQREYIEEAKKTLGL